MSTLAEGSSFRHWTICLNKHFESTLDEMDALGQEKVPDTLVSLLFF